ncbi:MAG: peptide chain release factor 1 [Firmicutes bacterium]|nr:peptide chain release factor 1 [Bacillota bacterium]
MLDRLQGIVLRFEEIESQLNAPETYGDPALVARLNREQRELTPVTEAYRSYRQRQRELDEAKEMLSDPDLRDMAKEEMEAAARDLSRLEEELRILLLPTDPNNGKNVIVEIRAGVGGEEAALFADALRRMYMMYAEKQGFSVEIANINETELGGIKEISFVLEGEAAFSKMKYESGVHRVQRVPETESGGRIHTSTCTVAVLPEVDEVEFEMDPGDLKIDTFRSSGAGGQHVNKTESAIRITHLPTGTVVECQDQRSQHKNKDRAMQILRSRLYERKQEEQAQAVAGERRSQVGSGMRNERIRTYNFPQGRLTDHRIGLTIYKLDQVMDGDLEEIISALTVAEQAERLKAGEA